MGTTWARRSSTGADWCARAARCLPALAGVVGLAASLWIVSVPAQAESLVEALSATYGYNPRLDAQRAFQRGTDEDVARAMSGYRPTVTGNADVGIERDDQRPSSLFDGVTKPRGYGVQGVQPIFRGFRTYNAVNDAEANVRAEREVLRDVERSVLLQAVTAYMDVVRDQELVRLNENNVNVLSRELKAAQDRFAVGEVTRTDVAQAEARRADAVSRLDAARANLRTSRGSFQQVVGHPPERPVAGPAPPESVMPQVAAGCDRHQQQRGPAGRRRALPRAGRQVPRRPDPRRAAADRAARGELRRPLRHRRRLIERGRDRDRDGRALTSRSTRRATSTRACARPSRTTSASCSRSSRSAPSSSRTLVAAWSQLEAARAQLESDRVAVESNKVALQGVREEEKVGQRTLLDVLNAELEYLNSQVNLETDRRNLVVAAYAVISAMGRLDVAWIGAAAYVYDPNVHYKEVRRKWIGLSITHADGRVEQLDTTPVEQGLGPAAPREIGSRSAQRRATGCQGSPLASVNEGGLPALIAGAALGMLCRAPGASAAGRAT